MYRVRQIQIRKGHKLYDYCCQMTDKVAKLYNRANYIVRQYATGIEAEASGRELHDHQKEILQMVRMVTDNTKYQPKKVWMNYNQLDYILKKTKDENYYGVPSHVNQQTLKMLMRDYKSFFEGLKRYKKCPDVFTGRPRLPHYKKSAATAVMTNEICVLREGRYLKLPKCSFKADMGQLIGRLKEVRIKPSLDIMSIEAVMEVTEDSPCFSKEDITALCRSAVIPVKVMGMDPGVNNLLAVTNNFGEQPFLISGRYLKSVNQYYNKKLARLKSAAELCNGKKTTRRIRALTRKRNNRIKDAMHKISSWVTRYAREQDVKLVVMGHNKFQKQDVSMGKQNNQSFVQIPIDMLRSQLKYKLEAAGIAFLCTEEAYSSKSDYLAGDDIPEYTKGEHHEFSGMRIQRGLYRHYNGRISNADINGAANILRKVFPNVPKELWNRGLLDSPYLADVCY